MNLNSFEDVRNAIVLDLAQIPNKNIDEISVEIKQSLTGAKDFSLLLKAIDRLIDNYKQHHPETVDDSLLELFFDLRSVCVIYEHIFRSKQNMAQQNDD